MGETSRQAGSILSFGRFELSPGERSLTADGAPVELGARTLDTLIALASRPNQVVGKRDLMAEVWPDVTVEEGSLRFHIARLRKALGDGKDGARFIATLSGRGYCFVAPVVRSGTLSADTMVAAVASSQASFLPARLTGMVGRADTVRALASQLTLSRFVTIVGPGGMGKTTVAVAVAHELLPEFAGAVFFVDLGMLSDPGLVAPAVASILGLSVPADDVMPLLSAFLRDKHLLLLLDSCEHVIEGVARLALTLFMAAPKLHILATSRESLRVDGEWVHRLEPLALPPEEFGLTAAALNFPATQLFVERAVANGARAEFDDSEASIVAGICRKLDGVALAIELAAGRVATYGLVQTAALLEQRFALLWPGKRTAPPRQQSLNATLDWSYSLLSKLEQDVLRRLAVFVGHFTLDAAHAVASGAAIDRPRILGALESLVGKSMVATHPVGTTMRYRLLDTTRAYLLEIGMDTDELAELSARHARYYQRWLEQAVANWPTLSNPAQRASHRGDLANSRSALEWCFGETGNLEIGIGLAAAAAPVFLAMSLLTDCQRWSERALLALGEAGRGGRAEMRLQAAFGLSAMWTRGNSEIAHKALNRSIAIAEDLGDTLIQIQLISPLHVFRLRAGEFRAAMQHADHVAALAKTSEDPAARSTARILLGFSLHLEGQLSGARRELEAALRPDQGSQFVPPRDSVSGGMQGDAMAAPILALLSSAGASALSRTFWLQGEPLRALQQVDKILSDPSLVDHPVTLLAALHWAISVLLWNGDLDAADQQADRFIFFAETYCLKPQLIVGRGFKGEIAVLRGDIETGIALLQVALEQLHALRYELLTTSFNIALVKALAASGRFGQAFDLIEETIRSVHAKGDLCYLPELLRVKAGLLRVMPQAPFGAAESILGESLDLSRRQGARAWELRASIDMARHLAAQESPAMAIELLKPVLDHFPQGSDNGDLRTARSLLAIWQQAA